MRQGRRPLPVDSRVFTRSLIVRSVLDSQVQEETGAAFIAPYNYGPTICGQGTIGLEFLQQIPDLDCILVPISGGGMCGGVAVAAKGIKPGIQVIAAEPTGVNDAADVARCKAEGRLVADAPKPRTLADGLQARLGSLTWPLVRDFVDDVVTVSEQEIIDAMRLIYNHLKVSKRRRASLDLQVKKRGGFTAHAGCGRALGGRGACGGAQPSIQGKAWRPAAGRGHPLWRQSGSGATLPGPRGPGGAALG